MIHFQEGQVIVFTDLKTPGARRLAESIAEIVDGHWRELLQERGEVEATPIIVFHANDPEHRIGLVINRDFVAIRIDPIGLANLAATSEFDDAGLEDRVRRALNAILAEQTYRLWMFYQHGRKRPCSQGANVSSDWQVVVVYYARDQIGFEALQFVVETTGELKGLLADVEAYRAEHGLG